MRKSLRLTTLLSSASIFMLAQTGWAMEADKRNEAVRELPSKQERKESGKDLVSLQEAQEQAIRFLTLEATSASSGADRKIADSHTEYDGGVPALYIFNFENGGFAIVSANKRQGGILAYSETGNFPIRHAGASTFLGNESMPDGVLAWIENKKVSARRIRNNAAQEPESFILIPPPGGSCTDSYNVKRELPLQTKWDQGCGWNQFAPEASNGPCGRAWAGCVAVAMAQIMRYHQFPSAFDWASMANTWSTTNTAWLLRDIGNRVNMSYGGDGSGAYMENVDAALEQYGYSTSAQDTSYSFYSLKNEISAGRPVVMSGSKDCSFLGFPTCGGHAWVVHGFQENYVCETGILYRYILSNWGWGGSLDGWYAEHDITPGDRDYNYNQKLVIGITP